MLAFTLLLQIVIGFFATAGAAGADFGMNNRNETGLARNAHQAKTQSWVEEGNVNAGSQ